MARRGARPRVLRPSGPDLKRKGAALPPGAAARLGEPRAPHLRQEPRGRGNIKRAGWFPSSSWVASSRLAGESHPALNRSGHLDELVACRRLTNHRARITRPRERRGNRVVFSLSLVASTLPRLKREGRPVSYGCGPRAELAPTGRMLALGCPLLQRAVGGGQDKTVATISLAPRARAGPRAVRACEPRQIREEAALSNVSQARGVPGPISRRGMFLALR